MTKTLYVGWPNTSHGYVLSIFPIFISTLHNTSYHRALVNTTHVLIITIRCIISYTESSAPSTTGNITFNLADTVYA